MGMKKTYIHLPPVLLSGLDKVQQARAEAGQPTSRSGLIREAIGDFLVEVNGVVEDQEATVEMIAGIARRRRERLLTAEERSS